MGQGKDFLKYGMGSIFDALGNIGTRRLEQGDKKEEFMNALVKLSLMQQLQNQGQQQQAGYDPFGTKEAQKGLIEAQTQAALREPQRYTPQPSQMEQQRSLAQEMAQLDEQKRLAQPRPGIPMEGKSPEVLQNTEERGPSYEQLFLSQPGQGTFSPQQEFYRNNLRKITGIDFKEQQAQQANTRLEQGSTRLGIDQAKLDLLQSARTTPGGKSISAATMKAAEYGKSLQDFLGADYSTFLRANGATAIAQDTDTGKYYWVDVDGNPIAPAEQP